MTTQPIAFAPSAEAVHKPILVGLLGPLYVLGGQAPSSARMRRTLALLALRAGDHVLLSDFYRELWDEKPVGKPAQSVQTYILRLRQDFPDWPIATTHGGYTLAIDPAEVDALRFESLTAQAHREFQEGRLRAAQDTLRAAASLRRDRALVDVPCGSLLSSLVAKLEDRYAAALDLGWEIALRSGRHREVVDDLAAACRSNPGREDTAAKLMLAQYRSSRRADALATYQRLRAWLIEEIGLEPCPTLQRLQGQILAGDPSLELETK